MNSIAQTQHNVASPEETLAAIISDLLPVDALPEELEGLSEEERGLAGAFIARLAARRPAGRPAIAMEAIRAGRDRRMMRLAIINDDMPYLVESIASALAARGLPARRLLHPVWTVQRDAAGRLVQFPATTQDGACRESIIYMEMDRLDAQQRQSMAAELETVLADVRMAVEDAPHMRSALQQRAEELSEDEHAALLHWLLEGNMTLLGHCIVRADGQMSDLHGVARTQDQPFLSGGSLAAALDWFRSHAAPLLQVKADNIATVRRRAPFDLILLPCREGGEITAIQILAGLWTPAALAARPDQVPLLRSNLAALEQQLRFEPNSHAGKTLRSAIHRLPNDLLIGLPQTMLRQVALTAMSIADRPRSRLLLANGHLGRVLTAFVWMARDDMTTGRRAAIGEMLLSSISGRITHWAIDAADGDAVLLRYTIRPDAQAAKPDPELIDRKLEQLLRGWEPAVEAALVDRVGRPRAARLTLSHARAFPADWRTQDRAAEAAEDIVRLAGLADANDVAVRLYASPANGPDASHRLHLKIYRSGRAVRLSDMVPVLENFGFSVLEVVPTRLANDLGHIHAFLVEVPPGRGDAILTGATATEDAIAKVLKGCAESDPFNRLIISQGLTQRDVVLFRAWFRYLRQTGMSYGLITTVDALAAAPAVTRSLIDLFDARHDPDEGSEEYAAQALETIDRGLTMVAAIDDDRILRRLRGLVEAILRTNAFAPSASEALAFKLDSALVPDLPAPRPWREIWVYSPRVEGIHLRGGPVARGGLRWSDRRDDFRTEILGLMKAQIVKNAVIVPTGAKGGFYPKQLPPIADRAAWISEGTECYRIFIRALLSLTDNIAGDRLVHPQAVRCLDRDDPYLVVAADKGTASFSDVANGIAVDQGFWLGDAFASGGSNGYDHKAMGITARGAWISVARHFAEMGTDVQTQPFTVAGCGDMSGDVFGNGMLLSRTIRLVAAFDHRHIFIDPAPDALRSWQERARLFALSSSSWADYDAALLSPGGGIFPRSQKTIPVSAEAAAALGMRAGSHDPESLIQAILKAPVDLLWFGGIGTYIKASSETNAAAGDPANDANRVDAGQVRARVIGEGANLSTTQAGRIEYSLNGGRINSDFIDNSAGVDCSDNEVNIKIALASEVVTNRMDLAQRNELLATMTDEVAQMVLDDNRLQTLALSLAERGGTAMLPAQITVIGKLEELGRLDRSVEGLQKNEAYMRRAQDGDGLTRPELAIILSHGKLALQSAIEASPIPADPALMPILHGAFPSEMQKRLPQAIEGHRLRREIIATRLANMVINRLGVTPVFELAEEEGLSLARVAGAYLACDFIFGLTTLFDDIEKEQISETVRLELLDMAALFIRGHVADLLSAFDSTSLPGEMASLVKTGVLRLAGNIDIMPPPKGVIDRLRELDVRASLAERISRLAMLDGVIAIAALAARKGWAEEEVARAYARAGEELGLDWAMGVARRTSPADPWERQFMANLARDFRQLRLSFLANATGMGPLALAEAWLTQHAPRVERFASLVQKARTAPTFTPIMLAQVAAQARILLARPLTTE